MATITTLVTSYPVELREVELEFANDSTAVLIGPTVKKGERVAEVVFGYDNLGADTTVTVGDGDDADRFITSTATTSAGVARLNAISGMNYEYTADDTIDVTLTAGDASGTVKVSVLVVRTFD